MKGENMDTQNKELLEYLQDHGSITPLEALSKLGIYRLSARIFDLRQDGHRIETNMVEEKDRRGRRCRVSVYTYLGRAA